MSISSFVLNNTFVGSIPFVRIFSEREAIASFCSKEVLGALGICYLMYQGYKYIQRPLRHVFSDGSCYEGYLVNGKKEGKGKYTYASGDCYEGDFVNDKRKGKGKYSYVSGDCYEGSFVNNKKEGKGKYIYANGDCYEGEFVNDKKKGKGKYTYVSGNCYEGDFVNDKAEGKGKWTCFNGDCYEGCWKNNEMISSNIGNLGDDLFFDLLCGSHQISPPHGYCLGIVLDYLEKKGYKEIAALLREARRYSIMSPEEIKNESQIIYRELKDGEKIKLICFGVEKHNMGVSLVSGIFSGFILCEIFNSGAGLQTYHKKKEDLSKIKPSTKYKTMLQVKIPVKSLTPEWIEILLSKKEIANIREAYEHILNFPGAEILPSDSSHWQTAQKGNDCSLQWFIKVYCEHKMEDPKGMRKQLKEDCRKAREARMNL